MMQVIKDFFWKLWYGLTEKEMGQAIEKLRQRK